MMWDGSATHTQNDEVHLMQMTTYEQPTVNIPQIFIFIPLKLNVTRSIIVENRLCIITLKLNQYSSFLRLLLFEWPKALRSGVQSNTTKTKPQSEVFCTCLVKFTRQNIQTYKNCGKCYIE